MIEFVTPALAHLVIEYVASSPVIPHISPAPTATFAAPSQEFSPVATMADKIVCIPAPSIATEMEMAKVTGVLCAAPVPMIEPVTPTPVVERTTSASATTQLSPAFTMAADAECMIREQIVEGVKISPQEYLYQRINDQIVDIPVSSIAEVPGVPCATPVDPQVGDFGFDKDGRSCEIIWPGQGSLPLGKTRTIRVGPMDTSQRLHCLRARCQAQEALTLDGVRDGYQVLGTGSSPMA